ncbi:MAG: cupredoxin domain-containing protein [Actinomycetota bacterium]|nr:cupredoxin domain-containing protein [Actinomycetota bacterium]
MIMIKNFAFAGTSTVHPGTKIMIMNMDSEAHTVTADTGKAFDVKVDPGKSVMLTAPSKPGTYAYHCNFHSSMHGTLKVS